MTMTMSTTTFVMVTTTIMLAFLLVFTSAQTQGGDGRTSNFVICNNQRVARVTDRDKQPSLGDCESDATFRRNVLQTYPFATLQSKVQRYICPTSNLRIQVSNGIPNHSVTPSNRNGLCEHHYFVQMPLKPKFALQTTEPAAAGIIAVALNGVPIYGAQESGGTSAVEPLGTFTPVPPQGHAGGEGAWHYHSGEMGLTDDIHEIPSTQLLGYAADGFPIYGPVQDDSVLDECGGMSKDGKAENYRYHVRLYDQIDETATYCVDGSEAVQWGYVLGCYKGEIGNDSKVSDSVLTPVPDDCVEEEQYTEPTPTDPTDPPPVTSSGPNIIVMQPDDFDFFPELGSPPPSIRAAGRQPKYPPAPGLPNIEQMIEDGVQMNKAYTASAMCGTSRYSTLTGRYPSRSSYSRNFNAGLDISSVEIRTTKLDDVDTVPDGDDCSEGNLAALLSENGYDTGVVGKWHLSRLRNNEYSYSALQDEVKACGFQYADALYKENLNGSFNAEGFNHNLEYVAEKAIEFMTKSVEETKKPFFMYLNPTAPHASGNVADALRGSCLDTPAGTLNPQDEPKVVGMTAGTTCRDYRDTIFQRAGIDKNSANEDHNSLLGSIWVDDVVGSVIETLRALGQLDNTVFIFQMDQGQDGKGSLYEQGSRILQIVRYPNEIQGPTEFNGLVSTVDIAPTILDYAGVGTDSPGYYITDGVSWRSAVRGNDPDGVEYLEKDRCLYFELDKDRAVRCGCFKYMKLTYTNQDDSGTFSVGDRFGLSTQSESLFDLCNVFANDPGNNPEEAPLNVQTDMDAMETLTTLQERMDCHLTRTRPGDYVPDYDTCGESPPDSLLIGQSGDDEASDDDDGDDDDGDDNDDVITTGLRIGRNGTFTIFDETVGFKNDEAKIKLAPDFLYEMAKDGKTVLTSERKAQGERIRHSIDSFARQDFTISEPEATIVGGVRAEKITFESSVGTIGTIDVVVYRMKESGVINFINEAVESFESDEGDIKFNIILKDWTFCDNCAEGGNRGRSGKAATRGRALQSTSAAEYIDFGMQVVGRKSRATQNKRSQQLTYDLGANIPMILSTKVKVGDVWQDMPEGFPRVELTPRGYLFVFRFPRFPAGKTAVYDPVVRFSQRDTAADDNATDVGGTSDAPRAFPSFLFVAMTAVSLLFLF